MIPRAHQTDLFALEEQVRLGLWRLVDDVHAHLTATFSPDGYKIGVNVGAAAGQTIHHAHVHVIPWHGGDVPDPRGGVRWDIPEKAPYWEQEQG